MGQDARIAGTTIALAVSAQPAHAQSSTPIFDTAALSLGVVRDLIGHGYRAAPALMLGLSMLVAIPLVALAARIHQQISRDRNAARNLTYVREDDDEAQAARAFVEVVGPENTPHGARYAILRDMLRIGREDDNDIRIPSGDVDRYHAAIHREDMGDWHITDLSGADGRGISVNGQRCSDARLHDGDVIELGTGRLRFRAVYA